MNLFLLQTVQFDLILSFFEFGSLVIYAMALPEFIKCSGHCFSGFLITEFIKKDPRLL